MNQALVDYYRCPQHLADFSLVGELSADAGYFRFGPDTTCYGRSCTGFRAKRVNGALYDTFEDVTIAGSRAKVPFDPTDIINNLRYERYNTNLLDRSAARNWDRLVRKTYYFLRPLLHVSLRKQLQKTHLRDWHKLPFPNWPVDRTVENLVEKLLMLSLRAQQLDRIPFIWFWPDGATSCLMMTHDVETRTGLDFCPSLMDIDEAFGIYASFQIVPEKRYAVTPALIERIRERKFEVGVQDLNHDGQLYSTWDEFVLRAKKINRYAREYGAQGFRSAVLYRNQDWYDALDFQYDMSVPNVGHLDPQRGGCCTVMPYFVRKTLELPVTTIQDYPLFYILGDYSIDLWRRQIELIMEKHGLIHLIIHPDYISTGRARDTYLSLLRHISWLRNERKIWIARPQDVNHWWRQRAQMSLRPQDDGTWTIEGPGEQRGRTAYARFENGRLVYSLG